MKSQVPSRYRSRAIAQQVIAFSVSYERENLLARGLGLEHLREMLVRLARPVLRQGANLAYGGGWKQAEDNFTYELLRLINAEQEDNSLAGPDTNLAIGKLFNYSSWPYYLDISPSIEAQWINCCRIIRFSQKDAGLNDDELASDADFGTNSDRVLFNRAITLSAMRRLSLGAVSIEVADGSPEIIPPVSARICLGGRVQGFAGFMPGIFEEVLTTSQKGYPMYLLGGFGGATEALAAAIVNVASPRPPELTLEWNASHTPSLAKLLELSRSFRVPSSIGDNPLGFDALWQFVEKARLAPAAALATGLSDEETRELMTTRNMNKAVKLVRAGLTTIRNLSRLAS